MGANTFSLQRLHNIKRNKELLEDLGAVAQAKALRDGINNSRQATGEAVTKKRRIEKPKTTSAPMRTSARIAAAPERPSYNEKDLGTGGPSSLTFPGKAKQSRQRKAVEVTKDKDTAQEGDDASSQESIDELRASWSSWTASAPAPTRGDAGAFHFISHPDFTPNKSPAEVIREGAFGGHYFRPLYSKKLRTTISNDYLELPHSWIEGLDVEYYLTSPTYNPEANKFKVACGQSIEEWEASGWINHKWDVRGWFQWYCRFFEGRRCEDDERQISRWKKCVGPTGRWRRMLLKKYVSSGVRTVWDDGEDEDTPEVSPVMHQTCHHWAFEVTQDILEEYWNTGK